MRGRSWTSNEEEKLIELWKNTNNSYKQIGDALGRSLDSVAHRIRNLRKTGILDYRNPKKIKNKYKKDLSNLIKLTPSGAYFITSVLGDGHVRSRCVQFKFRKRDCAEFRDIMCHILNITPSLSIYWEKPRIVRWKKWQRQFGKRTPDGYAGKLQIYSVRLVELLAYTYGVPVGQKSGLVRLPRRVMKSKNPKIHGGVLRAAYECEGGVNLHDRALCITISNTAILFLQDLSELLDRYTIDHKIYGITLQISALKSIKKFYELTYGIFNLKLNVIAKKLGLETLIERKAKKRPLKRRKDR